jgi:hypothetical protein
LLQQRRKSCPVGPAAPCRAHLRSIPVLSLGKLPMQRRACRSSSCNRTSPHDVSVTIQPYATYGLKTRSAEHSKFCQTVCPEHGKLDIDIRVVHLLVMDFSESYAANCSTVAVAPCFSPDGRFEGDNGTSQLCADTQVVETASIWSELVRHEGC